MPWPTFAAVILCWAGVILFCATGHEAIITSLRLLNSTAVPGFVLPYLLDESL